MDLGGGQQQTHGAEASMIVGPEGQSFAALGNSVCQQPASPATNTGPYPDVIALVNPKSGERASAEFLLGELRRLLPGRVCDLSRCFQDQTPAVVLIQRYCLATPSLQPLAAPSASPSATSLTSAAAAMVSGAISAISTTTTTTNSTAADAMSASAPASALATPRPPPPSDHRAAAGMGGGTVIVAGGDGTVSFAMDIIRRATGDNLAIAPFVAVIPMGTGNDLSRSLGFGGGFSHVKCCGGCCACCRVETIDDVVLACVKARQSEMDRWTLTITGGATAGSASPPPPSAFSPTDILGGGGGGGLPEPAAAPAPLESKLMNNYFSVGFDAQVARWFDTFRNDHPSLCQSRFMNKIWYGFLGLRACCGMPVLDDLVTLYVDGTVVPLPEGTKSLVVSNVDSYAGGMVLWDDSRRRFAPARINDGLLEIQAMFGSTHMAFMHIHLRNAWKICQGRDVRIVTKQALPMQFDGEPLRQASAAAVADVRITFHSKPRIRRAVVGQ